ncbi:MAG: hypothetical protein ACE147_00545 [Candidatus Methylomirabilales bacterium]
MQGWIRLHRAVMDHPVWSLPPAQYKVWDACLLLANHKDSEWWDGRERVPIPAGSFVTSINHLAEKAKVTRQVTRDAIRNLQRLASITTQIRTQRWTMITVVNWHTYQGEECDENTEENPTENTVRTQREHSENTNGRMKEGKKETLVDLDGFVAFWSLYPRHVAKKAAIKAWTKLKPGDDLRATIMRALALQVKHDFSKREQDKIPHASTWLNGERWKDEVAAKRDTGPNYGEL